LKNQNRKFKNMAKQIASSLKAGNVIEYKDKLWVILKTHSVHPGKGNSVTQMDIRDLESVLKSSERFRTIEPLDRVQLDEKNYQFLYEESGQYIFMDNETYEQITIDVEKIGADQIPFLQDGMEVKVCSYEGRTISIELPAKVICEIIEADAVVKGQTASSSYKPAMLDNGVAILVPPYITAETKVVVRTEDATYLEKAK
jgi:elongation factor P